VSLYSDAIDGNVLVLEVPNEINRSSGFGSGPFDVETCWSHSSARKVTEIQEMLLSVCVGILSGVTYIINDYYFDRDEGHQHLQ